MKKKIAIFSALILITSAHARSQTGVQQGAAPRVLHMDKPASPRTPPTEEDIIRGLVRNPDAFYRGVGSVQLHRMGDVAAAAIIRVIGVTSLTDVQEKEILDMIHKAFEHIDAVSPLNRNPKTTLFLLNYLSLIAQDDDVKNKIELTRQFVLAPPKSPA